MFNFLKRKKNLFYVLLFLLYHSNQHTFNQTQYLYESIGFPFFTSSAQVTCMSRRRSANVFSMLQAGRDRQRPQRAAKASQPSPPPPERGGKLGPAAPTALLGPPCPHPRRRQRSRWSHGNSPSTACCSRARRRGRPADRGPTAGRRS